MNEIVPYLIFNGNCRQAMTYYADLLNGTMLFMKTFAEAPMEFPEEANERIFDSHLQANGINIRASDNLPTNEVQIGTNFSLFTTFSTNDQLENVFLKLSEHGKVWMPLSDNPDGKFGMVKDIYGISWMLNWAK